MTDARIEIDYRATGNLAGPLNEAKQGLSKLGESYDQLKRKAEAAEAEASRSASATGKRAIKQSNEAASRRYMVEALSGAGYYESGKSKMARGIHESGREYRVHQEVERLAQENAAVQSRKRSILAANTIAGGGVDLQRADRVAPASLSMRQHYMALEGRQRQAKLDAMQSQQSQDANDRAERASRASRRQLRELRRMFGPQGDGMPDLAGLSGGSAERRLMSPGLRFRGAPYVPPPPGGGSGGVGLGRVGSAFGTAASIAGIGTGIGLVAAGVHAWQRANHEMIEKSDNAAESYDTLSRSLNIQAGFSDADTPKTRRRMAIKAMEAAADKDFTYATATQLASSGFAPGEATGSALTEMLKGMNAMPAPGGRKVDPVALAEAAASYMTSQSMEKTGGNLRNVLAGVQTLYKSTNFQLADFSELAGQADTMRGRMTMGEQFGAFSVLRDVGKTAEEATTALRNIAIRTQTSEGSPAKTAALATLGLTPSDIDMQGESFTEVLDRLAKAIEGKDAPKVTTALEEVFGERTLAGITRLIEDRGKVTERAAQVGDVTKYEEDAKTMSTGPAAAKRRQVIQAETFLLEKSQKDDLLKQELAQQSLERGESAFRVWGREKQYEAYRAAGMDRDLAAKTAFGDGVTSIGGEGRLTEAKRTLAEKGVVVPEQGPVNPFAPAVDDAKRLIWGDGTGNVLKPSDPFDRTGKGTIGRPTNVIPRDDAAIRAENEQFAQEQVAKRDAGLLPAPSKTGGQQRVDREDNADMLRQIRDAILNQEPVAVIRGGNRQAPAIIPLMMLGAGPMTR